jgi:hypothetical protein
MSAIQLPPLACKSCKGTGRWDVGTEEEGPCRTDYCVGGVVLCSTCNNLNGGDEPAVGEFFRWNDYSRRDDVIPLCRMHLQRAHAAQDEECRGDYERDLQKDDRL